MSKSTTKANTSQEKMDVSAEKATTEPAIKIKAKVAPSKKILGRSGRGGT